MGQSPGRHHEFSPYTAPTQKLPAKLRRERGGRGTTVLKRWGRRLTREERVDRSACSSTANNDGGGDGLNDAVDALVLHALGPMGASG